MSLVEDAEQVAELQAMQNCGLDPEPLQMSSADGQLSVTRVRDSARVMRVVRLPCELESAFSQTNNEQSSFVSRSLDTDHPTRWQRRQAKQHRGADGSDDAQRSEAQQSQFIEETIEIPVSAQRQTGFRRSWRFLHCSAMMRKSSSGPQCSEDCGDVAG